jgi:hypothetical protein
MSPQTNEEPKRPIPWLSTIISAAIGITVTVAGTLIIGKLQSREPHLSYSIVSSIPFSGPNNVTCIYQISLTNDGKSEIENINFFVKIPSAKIEQYKTSIAPSITVAENISGDTLKVQIASLNPTDSATVSLLASGANSLPSRPDVSIHAKGINGEEKPRFCRGGATL